MSYRNPQSSTRVSRRSSLIGGQSTERPELHLQIPFSATAANNNSSRIPSLLSISTTASSSSSTTTFLSSPYVPPEDAGWKERAQLYLEKLRPVVKTIIKRISYLHYMLLAWLLLVHYFEVVYPRASLARCTWPTFEHNEEPTRMLITSDPQLVDDHTYPSRPRALLKITEFVSDLYLRRNWVNSNRVLDPDTHYFLGDLFDGGREWDDAKWVREFTHRWNRIYTKPAYKLTIMGLPGNHDIGFGNTINLKAANRFAMFFGEPNSVYSIGNHSVVALDGISLMNWINETVYSRPIDFLRDLHDSHVVGADQQPRVLLTHVPLYRDPALPCGRHRESRRNTIPWEYGHQYQTMLSPQVSEHILRSVRPSVVFSGDDHDACHTTHKYTYADDIKAPTHHAEEFTVKTVSMAMGVRYPAVQLLSLDGLFQERPNAAAGSPEPSFKTRICYMPNPLLGFIMYGLAFFFSVFGLIAIHMCFPLLSRSSSTVSRKRSDSLNSPMVAVPPHLLMTYEKAGASAGRLLRGTGAAAGRGVRLFNADRRAWIALAKDAGIIALAAFGYFSYLTYRIYRDQ